MIEAAPEYGRWVGIAGFAGAKVDDVDEVLARVQSVARGACVQLFDARGIAGRDHLLIAALNALNAFNAQINISKKLEVEVVLYASGQRQIRRAIEMLGVKPGTQHIAAVVIAESRDEVEGVLKGLEGLLGERCDEILTVDREKARFLREVFRIADAELEAKRGVPEAEAVTELVVERVALLAVRARA